MGKEDFPLVHSGAFRSTVYIPEEAFLASRIEAKPHPLLLQAMAEAIEQVPDGPEAAPVLARGCSECTLAFR